MGLFSPEWTNNADAAEAAVAGRNVPYRKYPKMLYQVGCGCRLPEYRSRAIRALGECRGSTDWDRSKEAEKYLTKLASTGETAHDRCLAAALCPDRELKEKCLRAELSAACSEKPEQEWIPWIESPALLAVLYSGADISDRRTVILRLTKPELLTTLAKQETDETLIAEIVKKLSSAPELLRGQLQETENSALVKAILPYAVKSDVPLLEALLENKKHSAAQSDILHRLCQLMPESFAESYAGKYYNLLSNQDKLDAVRANAVSQEDLFETARWAGGRTLMMEAMNRITEPSLAISLLKSTHSLSDIPAVCYDRLAVIAAKNQEELADIFLQSRWGDIPNLLLQIIVSKLTKPELLLKLEFTGSEFLRNETAKGWRRLAGNNKMSVPEFEWNFGGKAYIRMLTEALQDTGAPDRAEIAEKHLGDIYRAVADSRGELSQHNGKTYTYHYDYRADTCGAPHVDRQEKHTVQW